MTEAKRPAFLITIDTEGDNVWARPGRISTENALYLPRFQTLCEEFGLKPTYLVNYEMACDERFVKFAKAACEGKAAEVGMHLHAWNSPPMVPLSDDDNRFHPFLTEFPKDVMAEKVARMTRLLEDKFGREIISHRGGRWAFDETYATLLLESGYLVDCSVTPHVSWLREGNQPSGINGPDFRGFPARPYWIDPADVRRPGVSNMLEIPMTIRTAPRPLTRALAHVRWLGGLTQRYWPEKRWLRPNGFNTTSMLHLCDEILADNTPYAMFMLHSSEFMPGGSPTFKTAASIEILHRQLRTLFAHVSDAFEGMTLKQFRDQYSSGRWSQVEHSQIGAYA